jgi:hypothetical protein
MALLAANYAAISIFLQSRSDLSYAATDRISLAPQRLAPLIIDYWVSSFIPFLHLLIVPFGRSTGPGSLIDLSRLAAIVALVGVAIHSALRPQFRPLAFCCGAALCCVALPSLVTTAPDGRFVYPAVAFSCLALIGPLAWLRGAWRAGLAALLAALWLLFAATFYVSPTLFAYRRIVGEVRDFVYQLRDETRRWDAPASIAIYDNPQPAWVPGYQAQPKMLIDIFAPGKVASLALDEIPSGTERVYRWDNGKLMRLQPAEWPDLAEPTAP